jgi:hypothetical protein
MNPSGHADLGPELRQLAQAILDRIDPVLRTAATLAGARSDDEPGKCQQVWCPVCALAALATGEEHPLLTVISEHSVALLDVVRAVLRDEPDAGTPPPEPTDPAPGGGAGRYQSIPIVVED